LLYLRAARGGCCIFVQQGEVAVSSCSKGRLLYLRAATPALRGGCCNSVQQPRLLDTAPGGLPATSTECMGESIQTSKLRPPHRPPHYAPAREKGPLLSVTSECTSGREDIARTTFTGFRHQSTPHRNPHAAHSPAAPSPARPRTAPHTMPPRPLRLGLRLSHTPIRSRQTTVRRSSADCAQPGALGLGAPPLLQPSGEGRSLNKTDARSTPRPRQLESSVLKLTRTEDVRA